VLAKSFLHEETAPTKHCEKTLLDIAFSIKSVIFVNIGSPYGFFPWHFFPKKRFASDKTPKNPNTNVINQFDEFLLSQPLRGEINNGGE
jgi:hypothetical protein